MSEVLVAGGVRLYHAMNLGGFFGYCQTGALLSRQALMQHDPATLSFYTDPVDHQLGLMSRTFGNLGDRGDWFATQTWALPNAFGPITLVFRPTVFRSMQDPVVVQTTTPAYGSLWRVSGVTPDALAPAVSAGGDLAEPWRYAELSCANLWLSLAFVERIIVEPVMAGNHALVAWVQMCISHFGYQIPVVQRVYTNQHNLYLIQSLAGFAAMRRALPQGPFPPNDVLASWYSSLYSNKQKTAMLWLERFQRDTLDRVAIWGGT